MAVTDKIWHLKQMKLLAHLDQAELARLGEHTHPRRYRRRELLFAPDDTGDAVYFIKEGRVRLYTVSEEGREITLAVLGPGDICGERALFDTTMRQVYAEAMDPAVICSIHREDFLDFVRRHPLVFQEVAGLLSERLGAAVQQLEQIAFKDVPGRLACLVLGLAQRTGQRVENGATIRHNLTHRELASLIGTTRETLTQTLSRLAADELLKTERGAVTVLDSATLRSLCGQA